jgi:hypothetical protein
MDFHICPGYPGLKIIRQGFLGRSTGSLVENLRMWLLPYRLSLPGRKRPEPEMLFLFFLCASTLYSTVEVPKFGDTGQQVDDKAIDK